MTGKVYQIVELVGTSTVSIEEAINSAIAEAAKSYGKLDWYEVVQTRGFIEGNKSKFYQVNVKIGCCSH